ncbi:MULTISPECIES: hypothetical protein [Aphanothece]|uniref:hypothetical protein n=1 Tax=Aphanothece TaxID=1121 RepID=UPI00398541B8
MEPPATNDSAPTEPGSGSAGGGPPRRKGTGNHPRARSLRPLALALALSLLAGACAEEPLPRRAIRRDDCLRNVRLDRLSEQLKLCNGVVEAFPEDPGPRNDRYLLHSLAGNDPAACEDMRAAVNLAARLPAKRLDPQLRNDLKVRQELCQPSAAAPS